MKSTKIEDIIDKGSNEFEELISSDLNDVIQSSSSKDDESQQNELKSQLDSIRSELNGMKNQESTVQISDESNEHQKTIFEKVFHVDKNDWKLVLALFIIYYAATSTNINDFIDNMIPFTFYNHTFMIKFILFVLLYRVINVILHALTEQ